MQTKERRRRPRAGLTSWDRVAALYNARNGTALDARQAKYAGATAMRKLRLALGLTPKAPPPP